MITRYKKQKRYMTFTRNKNASDKIPYQLKMKEEKSKNSGALKPQVSDHKTQEAKKKLHDYFTI